ncbi:MAG: signal peptidase [Gammaproteobacteria bacterium]
MKRQALIGLVAAALFAFAGIGFAQAPAAAQAPQASTPAQQPAAKKTVKHMAKATSHKKAEHHAKKHEKKKGHAKKHEKKKTGTGL